MILLKNVIYHGAYGQPSGYKMIQHKYMGGGHPGCGGWIELLEVKDPPEGKCGIIIHEHLSRQNSCESFFTEWQTLEQALLAFEKYEGWGDRHKKFSKMPGFLRWVNCSEYTPWFYAKDQDVIIGDYVPPPGYLF